MADSSADSSTASPLNTSSSSTTSNTSMNRSRSSRTLLDIKGDGTREALVEHLLEVNEMIAPKKKPQMCKIERSPLFAQLETFLPSLDESNKRLDALPESDRHNLCMEASEDDPSSRYIELSILESDQMQDSKVFQLLNLTGGSPSTTTMGGLNESSSESSDETDSDDDDVVSSKNSGVKKGPLVRSVTDDEDDESEGSIEMSCDR